MNLNSTTQLRICVAVLTRDRPKSLSALLLSWEACERPPGAELIFLVVENGSMNASVAIVDTTRSDFREPLRYIDASPRGIPHARNAAVRFAAREQADLLLFVDDDERVSKQWLVAMVETYRQTGASLIGGPQIAIAPEVSLSRWQETLMRAIQRRYDNKSRVSRSRNLRGRSDWITIITANWMGHMSLFTEHDLSFDESLVSSGGSDAKFSREVTELGLRKAWAADAVVYETITQSRLSFRYQFTRARSQSQAAFHRRAKGFTSGALDFALLLGRLCASPILLLSIPLTGGRTALITARTTGWVYGRTLAWFGKQSALYHHVSPE